MATRPAGRRVHRARRRARCCAGGRRVRARRQTQHAYASRHAAHAVMWSGRGARTRARVCVCGLRRASICAAALALHTESSSGTRSVPTASARITNMAVLPFRFSDLILSGHSFSWQVLAPPLLRCRSEACVGAAAARGTPECNAQQDNLQRSVKRKPHCCFQRATRDMMQRERLHSCTS